MTEADHNALWQEKHKALTDAINLAARREPSGQRDQAIAAYLEARLHLNACLRIVRRRLKERP